MKRALITGISGQDGAYLAALLLSKGYQVFGTYRGGKAPDFWRLVELGIRTDPMLRLLEHDLSDLVSCIRLMESARPEEIYNLAAQSFIGTSFADPVRSGQIGGIGAVNLLEAIRIVDPAMRFYQASSSEMFGDTPVSPQDENTPFHPRNPYGAAKLYAHWMTVNYREKHGIFASSGILFNHESPFRGREFLTRRVSDGLARIRQGKLAVLELGNLDARRDWGYAREYVEGIWRMVQAEKPDTFVLATNQSTSVRDFVVMAGQAAGFELQWEGRGEREVAIDRVSGRTLVRVSAEHYRPNEPTALVGNAAKARSTLGWTPRTTLEELCQMMVEADIRRHESWTSS